MNEWKLPEPAPDEDAFGGDLPPFATLLEALGDIDDALDHAESDSGFAAGGVGSAADGAVARVGIAAEDGMNPDRTDAHPTRDTVAGRTMDIEGITLSLAIELAVRPDARGQVQVRGSTPTQWTATTVMPAFHKLTMHITREADGQE